MDSLEMQRERFARQFILVLAIGISFVFFGMIKRMAVGLLMAALFAGMFHPLFRKFVAWFGGRKALSATVTVTVLLLVVLVPLALFVGIVASQAVEVSSSVGPWIERQIQQPDQAGPLAVEQPSSPMAAALPGPNS